MLSLKALLQKKNSARLFLYVNLLSSDGEQDEARNQVDRVNVDRHRPILDCLQIHLSHPLSCCGKLELWPHQGRGHCLPRIKVHK